MVTAEKIITAFFLFMVVFAFFGITMMLVNTFTMKSLGYREVDCLDENHNKIFELTCEEEVRCGIVDRKFPLSKDYCKPDYKVSKIIEMKNLNSKYGENKK